MRLVRSDFGGPGGWDEGARLLGLTETIAGVEWAGGKDPAVAARVAVAAGHKRWVADVTSAAVRDYAWPPLWGYIASPPCQTFSMAGKGEGRAHLAALLRALWLVAAGATPQDAIAQVHDDVLDVRSVLSLEPLYVIRQHHPSWIAFEQVKEVQPLWDAYAVILRAWGYSVWTGCLNAEQYGVPQTRRRAILIASREREVSMPAPTHSRYYSRTPEKLDEGVAPWVSMAQALSGEWSPTDLVGFPRRSDGKEEVVIDGVAYRARDLRTADQPGWTVTEKARSWTRFAQEGYRFAGAGATSQVTSGQRPRLLTEPAHTITGKGTAVLVRRDWERHPDGASRFIDAPGDFDPTWPERRPSPTIVGSFRADVVAAPGYRKAGDPPRQKTPGSVRVTVAEAGVLQSFPADYPWAAAGAMTAQFQRVGDAIPPLLARAVLAEATGRG